MMGLSRERWTKDALYYPNSGKHAQARDGNNKTGYIQHGVAEDDAENSASHSIGIRVHSEDMATIAVLYPLCSLR